MSENFVLEHSEKKEKESTESWWNFSFSIFWTSAIQLTNAN